MEQVWKRYSVIELTAAEASASEAGETPMRDGVELHLIAQTEQTENDCTWALPDERGGWAVAERSAVDIDATLALVQARGRDVLPDGYTDLIAVDLPDDEAAATFLFAELTAMEMDGAVLRQCIADAGHIVNGRQRGHATRRERLVAAGVPGFADSGDDLDALRAWLDMARLIEADRNGKWMRINSAGLAEVTAPRVITRDEMGDVEESGAEPAWYIVVSPGELAGPYDSLDEAEGQIPYAAKQRGWVQRRLELEAVRARFAQGAEFRDLRKRAGLTQQQLADELGYGEGGQANVSNQERGLVGIGARTAKLWRIVCKRRIQQT